MNTDEPMSALKKRVRVLVVQPLPKKYYVVVRMGNCLGANLKWYSRAGWKYRYLYEDIRMAEKLAMFHGGTVQDSVTDIGKVYGK